MPSSRHSTTLPVPSLAFCTLKLQYLRSSVIQYTKPVVKLGDAAVHAHSQEARGGGGSYSNEKKSQERLSILGNTRSLMFWGPDLALQP